jgi:hypothetical protein
LINTACRLNTVGDDHSSRSDDVGGGEGGKSFRASATKFAFEAARKTQDVVALGNNSIGQQGGGGGGGDQVENSLKSQCLQLLGIVLIDHAPSPSPPGLGGGGGGINLFELYLSKLHRSEDFSFLFKGLLNHVYRGIFPSSSSSPNNSSTNPLLSSFSSLLRPISSSSTSGGLKSCGLIVESLTVLWKLLEKNSKFSQWLIKTKTRRRQSSSDHHDRQHQEQGGNNDEVDEWVELVELLLAVRNEWKADQSQIGLIRLTSFLLQTLTAETSLLGLNRSSHHGDYLRNLLKNPIVGSKNLKVLIRLQCRVEQHQQQEEEEEEEEIITLIDYFVHSSHDLILSPSCNQSGRLSSLYPSILLTLSNLSPFISGGGGALSEKSSTELGRIWLGFSTPSWILMEEGNPRLLFYLLEIFNNILFYHHLNDDSSSSSSSSRSNSNSNSDSLELELKKNWKFIYSLVQVRQRFQLLKDFNLEIGIKEARRLRFERKKRQRERYLNTVKEPLDEDEEITTRNNRSPLNRSHVTTTTTTTTALLSDKVAGKQREETGLSPPPSFMTSFNNFSQLSLNDSIVGGEEGSTIPFVGKNGFIPTEEWVASWRQG